MIAILKSYKKHCALVLGFFLCTSLLAIDFGITIGNDTSFKNWPEKTVEQFNNVDVWLSEKFTPTVRFYLSANGAFSFSKTIDTDTPPVSVLIPDLGLSYLSGVQALGNAGALEWSVGRISFYDESRLLTTGLADGVVLKWYNGKVQLGTSCYFTGLLVKDNATVSMSAQDEVDAVDDNVVFATKRVVYQLVAGVSQAILNQDIKLQLTGQNDLNTGSTEKFDSYYATVLLSGNPLPLTSYELGFSASLQKEERVDLKSGLLGFSNLTMYLPFKSSILKWDTVYSAPVDKNDTNGFKPVSTTTVSTVMPSIRLGQIMYSALDFSMQATRSLNMGLKASTFFRTVDKNTAISFIDNNSDSYYVGSEGLVFLSWEAFPELALGANAGLFIPNSTVAVPDIDPLLYQVSVLVHFKF
ncbi:MAG TPA: hypothetical protein VFC68_06045 [Treponemataceae bacterium]|nr:hypothetical protein [Treponemataceae bacterium]